MRLTEAALILILSWSRSLLCRSVSTPNFFLWSQEEGLVSVAWSACLTAAEKWNQAPSPTPSLPKTTHTQEQHELLPILKKENQKTKREICLRTNRFWPPKKFMHFFYWMLSGSLVLFIHVLVSCQFYGKYLSPSGTCFEHGLSIGTNATYCMVWNSGSA